MPTGKLMDLPKAMRKDSRLGKLTVRGTPRDSLILMPKATRTDYRWGKR